MSYSITDQAALQDYDDSLLNTFYYYFGYYLSDNVCRLG